MPLFLEVREKAQNDGNLQVGDTQRRWLDARRLLHIAEQQAESVSVAGDRLDTGAFVTAQMLTEKRLQQWTDQQRL
jgi:hypothetical protein